MAVGPAVLYGTIQAKDEAQTGWISPGRKLALIVTLVCTIALVSTTLVITSGSQTLVLMKAEVHGEPPTVHVQPVIKSSLVTSKQEEPGAPAEMASLADAADPGFAMGVLVPLYSYPTWYDKKKFEWGAMVKQANKNQVEVIAIINPANGPGGIHPNADYAKGIKTLLDSGATLVGYVQTLWGTRDPNEVKNEIEVYRSSHFGFHGVFLDQVPNIWSKEYQTYNYYKMFFDFVKAKNWAKRHSGVEQRFVILNPGSQTNEKFSEVSDIVVLFDDFWDCSSCEAPALGGKCSYWDCMQWKPDKHANYFNTQSTDFPDHWLEGMESGNFSVMVHDCPGVENMTKAIKLAQKRNIGWIFVTDGSGDKRYDHLPSYWEKEVEIIAQLNNPELAKLINQTEASQARPAVKDMQNASLSVDHPVVPVPPPVKFAKVAGKKGKKGAQKAKADNDKYKKLARRAAKLLKKSSSKVDVHVSSSSK
jgi:hypothetical protein